MSELSKSRQNSILSDTIVSVKDFGAVGDGVTNDRTAIANADIAANGTEVVFPVGTYLSSTAYASSVGSWFKMAAGAAFSGNKPTGVKYEYERARSSATAGSKMKIDRLFEAGTYALEDEGGIWPGSTYSFFGVSKEFNASDGGSGGPVTSLFAFANNTNCAGDVVAILGDAVARTANGTVFGGNLIARNDGGINGTKLVGLEIDVEPAVGTTISNASYGLIFNIFSIASDAGVGLVGAVGGGSWANGFITSHIRGAHYAVQTGDPTTSSCFIDTQSGNFSSAAIRLGNGASQAINFGGGSFGTSPFLYGDSGGGLNVNMGASGFLIINNPAGAQRFTFDQYGGFNMPNNGVVKINSTQVIAQRDTGWTAMTGTADKSTAYATSTVTLAQLAGRVMSIQAALTTHGLIGA